jgi:UDP-N-acetylmuramyl tripeptide synthase
MLVVETNSLIGSNRYCDRCVIEHLIEFSPGELDDLGASAGPCFEHYERQLEQLGLSLTVFPSPVGNSQQDSMLKLGAMYAATAVCAQRAAGHRVSFSDAIPQANERQIRVVFEYEQIDVGRRADNLSLLLLANTFRQLDWPLEPEAVFHDSYQLVEEFKVFAGPRVLPQDTWGLIEAAEAQGIPWAKLDRPPFNPVQSNYRIRTNGLLRLGIACHQHTVDGTFCVDRGPELLPLIKDRDGLYLELLRCQAPVPRQDLEFRNCVNARRAERLAEKVGYPVAVKPALRSGYSGIHTVVKDRAELRAAVERAQTISRKLIVEQYIAGDTYCAVVANGTVISVTGSTDDWDVTQRISTSTLDALGKIAAQLNAGLFSVDIVTEDISLPLRPPQGAIVDVELAPELDKILEFDSRPYRQAMSEFMRWLFPAGSNCRVPIVAITGTNGKTTTSKMISHIMRTAGRVTGLACTDGVYIDEVLESEGDLAGSTGHQAVFESKKVDFAVLETARGAIAHAGFMFDWCDVATCLNVTADHLGEHGIETVEQMAELKSSVIARARGGVVLNADDSHCREMLRVSRASRIALVSLRSSVSELADSNGEANFFLVLETIDNAIWLVMYDRHLRIPVIASADIPATCGGLADFMISNSMHAIAACYLTGAGIDTIRAAMSTFETNYETTPGRLNFYDGHRFKVLMDFAHNPDGIAKLSSFVDHQVNHDRKLLMFQARGDVADSFVKDMAAAAAGHYDHFVCRSHPVYTGPDPERVVALMREALMERGVRPEQITTTVEAVTAVDRMLKMARPGDLLVFAPGSGQRADTWKRIKDFATEQVCDE